MPLFQAGLSSYNASLYEPSSNSKNMRQTAKRKKNSDAHKQEPDCGREGGASKFEEKAEEGRDEQKGEGNEDLEIGEEVLGLRDSYGASVLHVAALHGYSSILEQILEKWSGDVNLEDGNGLTAVDYAASGELADSETINQEAACKRCRRLLRSRGGRHSSIWLTDNPHAPSRLEQ